MSRWGQRKQWSRLPSVAYRVTRSRSFRPIGSELRRNRDHGEHGDGMARFSQRAVIRQNCLIGPPAARLGFLLRVAPLKGVTPR